MTLCSRSFEDLFKTTPLFYKLDKLCDSIVVGGDGVEFKTHKLILSKGSGYFNAFFKGNFDDMKNIVNLTFNSNILEQILIFVYTGEVFLADENIVEIIKVADFLLIDALLVKSRDFLLPKISLDCCIPLLVLSHEVERLQIKEKCFRFVQVNFGSLIHKCNSDIGKLPLNVFKDLISSNSLGVPDEDTVWKAIVNWIEMDPIRLKNVVELMRCIRWSEVSHSLTSYIAVHPIFNDNELCRGIHLEELVRTKIGTDKSENNTDRHPKNIYIFTYHAKFLIQAPNLPDTIDIFLTFDDHLVDIWRKIAETKYSASLIAVGQFIFLFDVESYRMKAFNLMTKRWHDTASIDSTEEDYSIVYCQNRILAVGYSEVRNYDPDADVWSRCASLPWHTSTFICKSTVLNDRLYVIGYDGDLEVLELKALTYDAAQDVWSHIGKPKQFREEFVLMNFHERLYILGGLDGEGDHLRSVEVYCSERNEWDDFPALPFSYRYPRAAILKDKLIVWGTCTRISFHEFPPCTWNEEKEAWDAEDASLLYNNLYLYQFCTVDDRHTIKQLAKENRDPKTVWVKTPFQ